MVLRTLWASKSEFWDPTGSYVADISVPSRGIRAVSHHFPASVRHFSASNSDRGRSKLQSHMSP